MRHLWILVLFLSVVAPARADLQRLLDLQRKGDSGAYVSSVFDDWRTTSKYRSRAGLHYGFDIAMWAGSEVRAAWSGKVVAITQWYGSEYGVTVLSPSGYETTYGHISPWVSVGDPVLAGTVLGSVVVDHVDVKMKNASGNYIDFAALPVKEGRPLSVEDSGLLVQDLSAAEAAYERYLLVQVDLERERFRYAQGWGVKAKLEAMSAELEKLKPLAQFFKPDGLPKPSDQELEKQVPSEGRPLTDHLLLGSPPHAQADSFEQGRNRSTL